LKLFDDFIFTLNFGNCREYVVDLVGKPGDIWSPDSSINGKLLSSVPTPFQATNLINGSKNYHTPVSGSNNIAADGRYNGLSVAKLQYSGANLWTKIFLLQQK
jgi:hypothetical protein